MIFTPANLTALIVTASFAAGLNLYATVLTLGLLARFHWVALPPGLDSLAHTWVLLVCGLLFAAEFVADKIPGFDLLWNALHTLVRVPVAALIAYHATSQLTPAMQVASTVLGGGLALLAHSSKTAVRAAVTPSPEPVSNIALSTAEDVMAVGLTALATHHPFAAAGAVALLLTAAIITVRLLYGALRRALDRWRSARSQAPATLRAGDTALPRV